jgi:hypothetical protein
MSRPSKPMTLEEARNVCREMSCVTCGALPGTDCRVVGDSPREGMRMRNGELVTLHADRWRSSAGYPYIITDV